jgi:hypothetical protein
VRRGEDWERGGGRGFILLGCLLLLSSFPRNPNTYKNNASNTTNESSTRKRLAPGHRLRAIESLPLAPGPRPLKQERARGGGFGAQF